MRQIHKAIKRNLIIALIPLCASFLGAALLCGTVLLCGTTAQASEPATNEQVIPNPAQTGSLTIAFTNEAGEPDKFGNKVGIYKVADIKVDAEIKGISLDAPSEEIWSDGTVTFKGVEAGLYLVVQTYRVSDSEKAVIEPFLAMIPERRADGTLNYDVKISSSGASDRKAGSESQNKMLSEITPDSKLPNTGGLF